MMRTILTTLLLLAPFLLSAGDEIVVRLSTEARLLPIYVTPIRAESSSLDPSHLAQVEKVFRFDLSHNGMTQLIDPTEKRTQKAWAGTLSAREDIVYYGITLEVKRDALHARVHSLNSKTVQEVEPLPLSGNLGVDRRVMHQLADAVHQMLFNKPGVASTSLLYTVRQKNHAPTGPEWLSEVWESDWDGANARQITFDGSYCLTPTYLPPERGYSSGSFFYVSYKTGQPKIFIASLRASERPRRFTSLRGNQLMPAVAANRMQVAFVNDVTGNPDLFVQRFDPSVGPMGKPYQIYSTRQGTQASPSFSPDGRQVAFVSNKDGSPRIYLLDVPEPGTPLKQLKPKLITLANRENTSPAWSPDGSKIAYSSKTDGTRQIWTYDTHSGRETQLTQGPGHKENPRWAPNSLHLVFNSASHNKSELYMINLNQPKAVLLTGGVGEKRFPDWEPISMQ